MAKKQTGPVRSTVFRRIKSKYYKKIWRKKKTERRVAAERENNRRTHEDNFVEIALELIHALKIKQ